MPLYKSKIKIHICNETCHHVSIRSGWRCQWKLMLTGKHVFNETLYAWRCTALWFDTPSEMGTTAQLTSAHSYHISVCGESTWKLRSAVLLTTVTTLDISSPQSLILRNCDTVPLATISAFPHHSPWWPPFYSLLLYSYIHCFRFHSYVGSFSSCFVSGLLHSASSPPGVSTLLQMAGFPSFMAE